MSDNSQKGIFNQLAMSHNILKFHCIFSASNQKANNDFQAFAISGNSNGVVAAKSDNCCNKLPAFSQSQSIVSKLILVCSKLAAKLIECFHNCNI
jgi:hypothetical protein